MKTLVTGGQLAELAARQYELFDRVNRGAYSDVGQVLDALHAVIEGRQPRPPEVTARTPLERWRTFVIGGLGPGALRARSKQQFPVDLWADDLMGRATFRTLPIEAIVHTILLTPGELGFERPPCGPLLLDSSRLGEWSDQNASLLGGQAIGLLPAESGPHIRFQYTDQPVGERLWIAMKSVCNSSREPQIFYVEGHQNGSKILGADRSGRDREVGLEQRFIFRIQERHP